MKTVSVLLLSLTLLGVSKCNPHKPPKLELCMTSENPGMVCNDPRRGGTDQNYYKEYVADYFCTNPSDYERIHNYCAELRTKLIQCEQADK